MEHEDAPRAQIHHKKPTIRINGTCPKPKCDFPRVKIQVDFQQGSRAMSRYFQVYRTARPLTLHCRCEPFAVGTWYFDNQQL